MVPILAEPLEPLCSRTFLDHLSTSLSSNSQPSPPPLENYLPIPPARKSWLTDTDLPSVLPVPMIYLYSDPPSVPFL